MSTFNIPSFFADKIAIPSDCQIVFVSDMFASDYQGGAELTTQALIDASPLSVFELHSKDVDLRLLEEGHDKFWIFGNFANLDDNLIPSIVANMSYSILEYDFKYCKYRSPEKHQAAEGVPCDCQDAQQGKMVSAFMYGARSLWWMSERQRDYYHRLYPFLESKPNTVLSSVFDEQTLGRIKAFNMQSEDVERSGWIVLDSPSWVKGADAAKAWCEKNEKKVISLWGLPYAQVLEQLAQAEGFVYLPSGMDTCPRMVIEAKLLGCELHLNENVLHKDELWFDTDDMLDTESYLYMTRSRFWNGIKADMEYRPTLSGYTTTRNCIDQKYPFRQSIASLLGFCDEVVVLDSGSTDGTWEELQAWAETEFKLKVHQSIKDYEHKRFAVFDGALKAEARSLCGSEFCWQQDSDEVVHENDFEKIRKTLRQFPHNVDILALPVIEYWGNPDKVRMDVMPWKWRLSRNLPHITHGIPKEFQKFDSDGDLYASVGTDGCDYIHAETCEVLQHASFYTTDVHQARILGLRDSRARKAYESWFNDVVSNLPGVHHYSWIDIGRKIRTYRDYWSKHWQSLYDITQEDTAENNMFFQKPWAEVTEDDIDQLAHRLAYEMGGWIFHAPVDFTKPSPHITVNVGQPIMLVKESIDAINKLSARLLDAESDDNWQSVRNPDETYTRDKISYPFGTRDVYRLVGGQTKYVDLQHSRGITVLADDSPWKLCKKVKDSLDTFAMADKIRLQELDEQLKHHSIQGFAELGFRVPKLQKHFLDSGASWAIGYDVADLSVETSKALGYNAAKYDFNACIELLDLTNADLVVSYHMLEHVTNPLQAIETIYNAMKAGALFHVEIPIEVGGPHIRYGHMYPFHPGDLKAMLNLVGFNIIYTSSKSHPGPAERCLAQKL